MTPNNIYQDAMITLFKELQESALDKMSKFNLENDTILSYSASIISNLMQCFQLDQSKNTIWSSYVKVSIGSKNIVPNMRGYIERDYLLIQGLHTTGQIIVELHNKNINNKIVTQSQVFSIQEFSADNIKTIIDLFLSELIQHI